MRKSPSSPLVVGVDTGARWTGLVVCIGEKIIAADTLEMEHPDRIKPAVVCESDAAVLSGALTSLLAAAGVDPHLDLVAVESIQAPRGHAKGRKGHLISPWHLMRAAALAATALTVHPVASARARVLVPPGGHGGHPLPVYRSIPGSDGLLVGARETTGGGKSKYQHRRSAYDVAQAGMRMHRLSMAAGKPERIGGTA